MDDPQQLRDQLQLPHSADLADLLAWTQARVEGYGFAPTDLKALLGVFKAGYELTDLQLVWEHHNTEGVPSTQWARDRDCNQRWSTLANSKVVGRIRDARRWDADGRPANARRNGTQLDWMEG